ncbi:hypothetical protein BD779DRAFT_1437204 [Infundibulicybe gibba]|nr:hypothetical protein BD779DRAFT_1437204 [Infundibulicybe gibba]
MDTPARPGTVTAVLSVNSESLSALDQTILPFLKASKSIREVLLVFPESINRPIRQTIRRAILLTEDPGHPEISLRPWSGLWDEPLAITRTALKATTELVLLMDTKGLRDVDDGTRDMLLEPPAALLPMGPRGMIVSLGNVSCAESSIAPQHASYLIPPFIIHTHKLKRVARQAQDIWANLGRQVSDSRSDEVGGIVIGYSRPEWCARNTTGANFLDGSSLFSVNVTETGTCLAIEAPRESRMSGRFALIFPKISHLRLLLPLACQLQQTYSLRVLIYNEDVQLRNGVRDWQHQAMASNDTIGCLIQYYIISSPLREKSLLPLKWLISFNRTYDVVVLPRIEDPVASSVAWSLSQSLGYNPVVVHLSIEDLPYTLWMSSLSLTEWRNWNVPRIELSVITKDRPSSLGRLLTSLSQSRFFGDTLDLRVHLEQSSDMETMRLVENFDWKAGRLFVHHRVIHGGLLPAVVESWYPHGNNTYGLLLEDDVELSPLFYAWAKMAILRYRHGDSTNKSPQLFGISLYQQKNLELPSEGRRPFDARDIFARNGIAHPSTPYLSPIPCSWGAVYFPEQWREFHRYLSLRLPGSTVKINQNIVPNVRSNKWTQSWKKYFIELVYLRGYVMLYPNFQDFVSLSTNHLEVGSHVKVRSEEKQSLFLLPLMQLPITPEKYGTGILELPDRSLPNWTSLPVLNLTGSLSSLESLKRVGESRRAELAGCDVNSRLYDILGFMCLA